MSGQLLASKIVIVEEEPRLPAIPSLSTAVVGAIGVTERGPVGTPVLVTSFEEYVETFGTFTQNSDLALAAQGFFGNGGQTLWVVRTVHYGDPNDPSSKTSSPATLTLNPAVPVLLASAAPGGAAAGEPGNLRIDAKWDGTYANDITILIAAATDGAADEFNLTVLDNGLISEVFPNLSMDPASPNYVETVVNAPDNGSRLIQAKDLQPPDSGVAGPPAAGTFGPLAGGNDGLDGIDDPDFVGSDAGKTGLHALDTVQELTILIAPGRATSAMHNALLAYCEVARDRSCFAILDPPANQSATAIVTYVEATAALLGLSEFGVIYWPRIKVLNPAKAVFGNVTQLTIPPSGHVAGVYSRVDASRPGGVYVPPAGIENGQLLGVLGFETDEVLEEPKRDLVFPKRVNPLTVFPGSPRNIDGARTLKADGNFPTVAERRGVIFIEQSLKRGLLFAKHKNNTEGLRATLTRTVTAFLLIQLKNGAFASTDPKKAFFVDFGDALNPPGSNVVVGRIGLATAKPAEFIVLRFSQAIDVLS